MATHITSKDREPLSGLVERVTFHSSETGFCVLRVKVRGNRDLVTVLGSAASIQPGEFIQASGRWDMALASRLAQSHINSLLLAQGSIVLVRNLLASPRS